MFKHSILFLSLFSSFALFADDISEKKEDLEAVKTEENILKVSEAFGHLIGKNIETLGVKFDVASIIKGLQDSIQGKNSPLSEEQCVQAITAAQEEIFKEQAMDNLKKAEEFMAKNENEADVKVLEKGKLHYKVEQEGTGNTVLSHFSPLIRYTGKYLDGTTFGASKEEELVSLDETIPGFSRGIIGMKEGEKRILFIHPDLAYGTSGYLPPNSLLQFEIELVKANAATPQSDSISSQKGQKAKSTGEVANSTLDNEALR
jgi:peptidylprolyl isomerase